MERFDRGCPLLSILYYAVLEKSPCCLPRTVIFAGDRRRCCIDCCTANYRRMSYFFDLDVRDRSLYIYKSGSYYRSLNKLII